MACTICDDKCEITREYLGFKDESPEEVHWRLTHAYSIFHPNHSVVNDRADVTLWPSAYQWVAYVYANSLNDALIHAQIDYTPEYAAQGERDTTVGDVIEHDGEAFMVLDNGFKKLSND